MNHRFLSFLFLIWVSHVALQAQAPLGAADTTYILEQMRFPSISANVVLKFNASMLDLNVQMPNTPVKTIDELKKLLADEPEKLDYLVQLGERYLEQNDGNEATIHIQKAFDLCMARLKTNPADLEAANQMSYILYIDNRLDIAAELWDGVCQAAPDTVVGWWQAALAHIQIGDFAKGEHCLEHAYKLDPCNTNIYVGEIMRQMYMQLSAPRDTAQPFALQFKSDLINRACKEHPTCSAAEMATRALDLMEIFLETLLENAENFEEEKPFKFKISADNKKTIKTLETYYLSQLQSKPANTYYAYKGLMVCATLQNNMNQAEDYLKKATKLYDGDGDMYKIIALGYMSQQQWESAIPHYIKTAENHKIAAKINDQLALAKIYYKSKSYDKAIALLDALNKQYNLVTNGDFRPSYGILASKVKMGNWRDAIDVLDDLSYLRSDAANEPNYGWYWACFQLLLGNRDNAKPTLEYIAQDSNHRFNQEAKLLLKRYFN